MKKSHKSTYNISFVPPDAGTETSVQSHLTAAHKKDMKTLLVECLTIGDPSEKLKDKKWKYIFQISPTLLGTAMVITTSVDQWESYSIIYTTIKMQMIFSHLYFRIWQLILPIFK